MPVRSKTVRRIALSGVTAVCAAGLLAAPTDAVATAATAADATPVPPSDHGPRLVTLPTGDQVRVTGASAAARAGLLPAPGHRADAITAQVAGRTTVLPAAALRSTTDVTAYQVSGPTDGGPAVRPQFAMSLLHITAVDHEGVPAAAEVIVVNTDDPAKANWDGIMSGGDSRIEVPAGHYSVAVAVFDTDAAGNPTETDLLSATDVTVPAAGTTVALDGRTASPVTITTPLPSRRTAVVVGWVRGIAGQLDSLDIGALAGTRMYVGGASAARTGILRYSVVAHQDSPVAGAYSYLIAVPEADHIPASSAYSVAANTLATVDSRYPTDQPSQDLALFDAWTDTGDGPNDPALPELPEVTVHAPTTDHRFISASPTLRYDAELLPLTPGNVLDGELDRNLALTPGQHLTLPWRGGVTVPAPATVDGPCFLCRQGNTLHGVDVMDTDSAGDQGQWSDGPTTITEDGTKIYSGDTLGQLFDQKLPAAKHRYVYSIDATHDTATTELATHTRIDWGFDSAQVTTSTVPASWLCTPCAPVQILYASTAVTEDSHDSVAPGPATITVSLAHQPFAADPAVTSAGIDVSYDNGATWQNTTTTLTDPHHATGTWTVPAGTTPGYLAIRVHAADAAGSTLDETVDHAALVNAPHGIANTTTPPTTPPAATTAVCPTAAPGHVRCLAIRAAARPSALPDGYGRADLLSAYHVPGTGGSGRTVAIVDAHDDPTAEADLAVYRKTYGLPPCTTKNGCFTKLNEHGKTAPMPAFVPDDDWSIEVSLDLDMVSAICPECHVILVESDDTTTASLGTAEQAATGSGAVAVSNSWGGDEGTDDAPFDAAFRHPGVAVTASSGDTGFHQPNWPASLDSVIAVGGTTLTKAAGSSRGWTETAWSGAGSGCSAYSAKPAWQHDNHCGMRTVADIAADADPATGLAVYVEGSWIEVGGTSASSPMIAAMIAIAGNSAALPDARFVYQHSTNLFDITSGSNKNWDCGGDYLCTATKGYDGPTGMGTPNGLGAL